MQRCLAQQAKIVIAHGITSQIFLWCWLRGTWGTGARAGTNEATILPFLKYAEPFAFARTHENYVAMMHTRFTHQTAQSTHIKSSA